MDNGEDEAITMGYIPYFDMGALNPMVGQTVRVFVDSKYISFTNAAVMDRRIFGFTHYALESDLAAVTMHSGVLFIDPHNKDSTKRQFCTLQNLFEMMCASDGDFNRRANVIEIPRDLRIRGVILLILFCNSPPFFQQSARNGIRSERLEGRRLSMRIANFRILSLFEEIPDVVKPDKVILKSTSLFRMCRTFTEELGFVFTKESFMQVLSFSNVVNGLFLVYRLFFDVSAMRYEVVVAESEVIRLSVLKFNEPIGMSPMRKREKLPESEYIVENLAFDEIVVGENCLMFGSQYFGPVSSILLMNIIRKAPKTS
jgi:hypothetical protein